MEGGREETCKGEEVERCKEKVRRRKRCLNILIELF
jgi:hypothetical protein